MSKRRERQYPDPQGTEMRVPGFGSIFSTGTTVPADAGAGYAPGCIFLDLNASQGAQFYINEGSATSCDFNVIALGGLDLSTLLATAAEINRVAKPSTRLVASGSSLTVTQALHDGKTIVLAAAAAVTLPAMAGTGSRFRFVLPQDATAVTITATGAHLFGALNQNNDTAQGTGFQLPAINAGGSTVITFNGTTQGGRKGDWVVIEDVASSVGLIYGQLNASGSEVTPFS